MASDNVATTGAGVAYREQDSMLMALCEVPRWGIVRVSRAQSVAEHIFRVLVIVRAILGASKFDPDVRASCMELALVHDIVEARSGDIPTPWKTKGDRERERTETKRLTGFSEDTKPVAVAVVELADLAECVIFLHHHGIGEHANAVRRSIARRLSDAVDKGEWLSQWMKAPMHEVMQDIVGGAATDRFRYESIDG